MEFYELFYDDVDLFCDVMCSIVTRHSTLRLRSVRTCFLLVVDSLAISTKGWSNRVIIDNNHSSDSHMQPLTRCHPIFGVFVCENDRKWLKCRKQGQIFAKFAKNLAGLKRKRAYQTICFMDFDYRRNKSRKIAHFCCICEDRSRCYGNTYDIRAVTSSSLLRHISDDDLRYYAGRQVKFAVR